MPTFLHIHPERTDSPQHVFRGKYELRHADYSLCRQVNHKGEIASEIAGGQIRTVIDGFGDETLFHWLFRPDIEQSGEVVTLDEAERVIEKFTFAKARATGYRLHFDAGAKNSVAAIVTIDAAEIRTENDLNFKKR
jgi:hypothetical protein